MTSIPSVGARAGDWVGPVLFAGLIVGVAGVTVWRAAFLADARGEPVRGLWRVAVGAAVGGGAGPLLALAETGVYPAGFGLTGPPLVVFEVWWYALLFAASAVFFRWVLAGASTWLPVAAASSSPRRILVVGPLLANELVNLGSLQDLSLHSPLLYVAVQLLWAVPLAAWLFRRRAAPVWAATWARLDCDRQAPPGSPPPRRAGTRPPPWPATAVDLTFLVDGAGVMRTSDGEHPLSCRRRRRPRQPASPQAAPGACAGTAAGTALHPARTTTTATSAAAPRGASAMPVMGSTPVDRSVPCPPRVSLSLWLGPRLLARHLDPEAAHRGGAGRTLALRSPGYRTVAAILQSGPHWMRKPYSPTT